MIMCLDMCVEVNKTDMLWLLNFQVPLAEEIYEQAINSLAQLEKEKSKLLTELYKLQIFAQQLKNGLSKAQEKHDRLVTVSMTFLTLKIITNENTLLMWIN